LADKKILFLCAHNQSRSVTAEGLLTGEKGYQVRSRALWRRQKRKVTAADGRWADEVYVMMPGMKPVAVEAGIPEEKVRSLWIPDAYLGCEGALLKELKEQLAKKGIHVTKDLAKAKKDCEAVMTRKMGFTFDLDWDRLGSGYAQSPERPSPESTTGYGYVPLWHFQEGERRAREAAESEEAVLERARSLFKFYEAKGDRKKQSL
jgi:predicted protein tyrosine phosphatase